MSDSISAVKFKHITRKLSKYVVFKLTADGKVEDGEKVICVHCHKRFSFKGSNTLLTYHLQHKYALRKRYVVNSDRKSLQVQSINNYLLCQSNKPVSDKIMA